MMVVKCSLACDSKKKTLPEVMHVTKLLNKWTGLSILLRTLD